MLKKKQYSERELVEGCLKNDRKTQEVLYRKHFSVMMNMCMRYTKDRDQAMEIVNDGFLKVFKKIDKFSFKGSLEGWIRRLVFHSLSDYFKKNSKYLQFLVFEERETAYQSTQLERMYVEDILKMVEYLPPASKRVFQLYAIDGYTHVEISKNIGISVGTSKWHLASARTKLKQVLATQNTGIANNAG